MKVLLLALLIIINIINCDHILNDDDIVKLRLNIAINKEQLDTLKSKCFDVSDITSSNYGNYLNAQDTKMMIKPDEDELNTIFQWLVQHNLPKQNISYAVNNAYIDIEASSLFLTNVFGLKLYIAEDVCDLYWKAEEPPKVLPPSIDFISRFSITRKCKPSSYNSKTYKKLKKRAKRKLNNVIFDVNSLWNMYNITEAPSASGYVALFSASDNPTYEFCGAPTIEDVDAYVSLYNLTMPKYFVQKPTNYTCHSNSEIAMDVETIIAMSRGSINTVKVLANYSEGHANYFLSLFQDLADSDEVPDIVSSSFGPLLESNNLFDMGDKHWFQHYLNRCDIELQRLCIRGVTVIQGAGDDGAEGDGNIEDNKIHPAYPASSSFALAVGSTMFDHQTLVNEDDETPVSQINNVNELCKSFNGSCDVGGHEANKQVAVSVVTGSYEFTTGGGFSGFSLREAYQDKVVEDYLNLNASSNNILPPQVMFNRNGRAYPDLASIGINVPIVSLNTWVIGGGTSYSAPSVAGWIARINANERAHNRSRVGFINPLLYYLYEKEPSIFTDITVGDNRCRAKDRCTNGYNATSKFDAVSGLGSLNIGKFINVLNMLRSK